MKPILQELYESGIFPADRPRMFLDEHAEKKRAAREKYNRFFDSLDDEKQKTLEAVIDDIIDDLPYENCELFIYAFQLGARIMLEVMTPLRKKP